MDAKETLIDKIRQASLADKDDDVIALCEAYTANYTNKDERLALGTQTLTWQDVVAEMRRKTAFGISYLNSIKDCYKEQKS